MTRLLAALALPLLAAPPGAVSASATPAKARNDFDIFVANADGTRVRRITRARIAT